MTMVTPTATDLREELKSRNLGQNKVAQRMGVSSAQLSRLLSGQRKWSLLTARAFSMATGISLSSILSGQEATA